MLDGRWRDAAAHLRYQSLYRRLREDQLKPFEVAGAIFVHIPKTAGVSLSMALFGADSPGGHRSAIQFRRIYGTKGFTSLFTFCFVREPIDRLLSAYAYIKAGGRSEFDQSAAAVLESCSSIEDFVVRWLPLPEVQAIPHFRPQTDFICDRHGNILVDFVGRYERLHSDFQIVTTRLGRTVELPHFNVSRLDQKPTISPSARALAEKFYARDFETFGYAPQ